MQIIVIEGMDGCGKGTQSKILLERLRKEGYKAELVSFPIYESPTGEKIRKYLHNELVQITKPSTFDVVKMFADDRKAFFKTKEWKKMKEECDYVIFDRYVLSNICYQGANLQTEREAKNFVKTVYHVEYVANAIPHADIEIFLNVSDTIRDKLIAGRARSSTDINENNKELLDNGRKKIIQAIKREKLLRHFNILKCDDGENMFSIERISEDIYERVIK